MRPRIAAAALTAVALVLAGAGCSPSTSSSSSASGAGAKATIVIDMWAGGEKDQAAIKKQVDMGRKAVMLYIKSADQRRIVPIQLKKS